LIKYRQWYDITLALQSGIALQVDTTDEYFEDNVSLTDDYLPEFEIWVNDYHPEFEI